jgi:GNAT superfamily N-acetyltransferase
VETRVTPRRIVLKYSGKRPHTNDIPRTPSSRHKKQQLVHYSEDEFESDASVQNSIQQHESILDYCKLTEREADSTRFTPTQADKQLFKRTNDTLHNSTKEIIDSRKHIYKRQLKDETPALDGHGRLVSEATPRVREIVLGDHTIPADYIAPYPEEYARFSLLYMCEYCLKYMKSEFTASRHKEKCPLRHPPGNEIYRDNNLSVFEVDGRKNKIYCQNLCLLAKLFLDHKTLYYDVEPFLFYVLVRVDAQGCHFIGYFSKEKHSSRRYNLSCIVILPIYRKQGYGQYLIDFSYLLSRKEGILGTPEKPLSSLGSLAYHQYWRTALFTILNHRSDAFTVETLSGMTGITMEDVVDTLHIYSMVDRNDGDTSTFTIRPDQKVIDMLYKAPMRTLHDKQLRWIPFILNQADSKRVKQQQSIKP